MKRKEITDLFIINIPEYEEIFLDDSLESDSSLPVESFSVQLMKGFRENRISIEQLGLILEKYCYIANVVCDYVAETKIELYSREDLSYGFFLSFETFAAYPETITILRKYLKGPALDRFNDEVVLRGD